ncbi:arsenate reductase [Methanolinea mesophila]|uniref:arsenate reductase/protein-tyrosine-phosphatase family protein n=1 Tax=Methanolinea mesophila TaxID=547055 RepID=UPI001AEA5EA0|nr:arsenate reductase ArsC [Methanolinea mesophila]MBP1928833.1 arsenate reductase [Methanolinea mesophila]
MEGKTRAGDSLSGKDRSGEKRSVLFVCNRNAGRSPLAEGLLRGIYGDRYEVYSAGVRSSTINPLVGEVLGEQGIEARALCSKALDDIPPGPFDRVVLLTAPEEGSPSLPEAREYLRYPFPDPRSGGGGGGSDLEGFRALRDMMADWIVREF